MNLPDDFRFSASSLQDFFDCQHRFYLRYVLGLAWPALVTEPAREHELHLQRGSAFHRMVQQHLNGVSAERLAGFAQSGGLSSWWESYIRADLASRLPGRRYVEFGLSAPFCGRRLFAKYDLIIAGGDPCLTIVDWKTSLRRPARETLLAQMQTRVYRYLLAQAGGELLGREPIEPEQVRMLYWFAEFPDQREDLLYDSARYQADGEALARMAEEILGRGKEEEFEETARPVVCKTCAYSSYCERGNSPIAWADQTEADHTEDLQIDFGAIEEIAY
jgi:hypothetical protein